MSQALLALQDEAGLDINCVLFCYWAGAAGFNRLTPSEMSAVLEISHDWNVGIVARLREVRRALKEKSVGHDGASDLYRSMKALELEAERIQQTLLANVTARQPLAAPSEAASRANLDAYLEARARRLSPPLLAALEHVTVCCNHIERHTI